MFLDLFSLGDLLVFVVAAGRELAARFPNVRFTDCFRAHGESRKQLLEILAPAGWTRGDGGLEDQQLELMAAAPAFVFVNRHRQKKL